VHPANLETASVDELNEIRDGLASEMKNKSNREDPLVIDYLRDFIAVRGYIMLTKRGEQMYVEEYRRLVEKRILDLVANHPTVQAIQRGKSVTDEQLLELERTLHKNSAKATLKFRPKIFAKPRGLKVDSFLLRSQVLELDALPDYHDVVQRQLKAIYQHQYMPTRYVFCVQCKVFLEKRKLEKADLYEPPLTNFGADAVERWFSKKEVNELVLFATN